MFYDNVHLLGDDDSVYHFGSRWHRFSGYVLPPNVFTAAEALFAQAKSRRPRTGPSMANVLLATALLRQALVFYPLDQRLLECVQRLHALVPYSSGFDLWLGTLQRFYRLNPDPRWTPMFGQPDGCDKL